MLLNLEITIKITNDGKKNITTISIDKGKKIIDILTALELSKCTIENCVENYIKKEYSKVTPEKFKEILNELTYKECINVLC